MARPARANLSGGDSALLGIGATLQFIILEWAEDALGMSLSEGAALQVIVSVGVAAGAIVAAIRIPLKRSLDVLPVGMLMGAALIAIAFYSRDIFPSEWSIALGPLH